MPAINITADQAAALHRGENITVSAPKPPKKNVYVVTTTMTNVFLLTTERNYDGECGRPLKGPVHGECLLLAKGPKSLHRGVPGEHTQASIGGVGTMQLVKAWTA